MSYTSLFELFKIGVGPSSSHTVGPMVAARDFVLGLLEQGRLQAVERIRVTLFGSLGLTGRGHNTDRAVVMGMEGFEPATVPMTEVEGGIERVARAGSIMLAGRHPVAFDPAADIVFESSFRTEHANVLTFDAHLADGAWVGRSFASIGGGFVVDLEQVAGQTPDMPETIVVSSAAEMLEAAANLGTIADIARANELAIRDRHELTAGIRQIAGVMLESIDRGLSTVGSLPGSLGAVRRAHGLAQELNNPGRPHSLPPCEPTDWAGVWAIAVNEENAAGRRIVTAPTNGAAGVVPAVMRFMLDHCSPQVAQPIEEYLLTATVIGSLLKERAGISGAELGCQGEVGSACSMAAAGLTAALGGTPMQVENAAEIAVEHNLGLTCDPVGGLVQVPCIERNAVGAVKAITAGSLALRGSGHHLVSLDAAIETMRQTGADMDRRYKETSLGGLAVNVPSC